MKDKYTLPTVSQHRTAKYKSSVVPSFEELRNRPYLIDSEVLPISDDSVLRDVQKYLSSHSNKSIGTLVGQLSKIFYKPPKNNCNVKPKAHRLFNEALLHPIHHPSLLLFLNCAYTVLTHCPQDVDSFDHPKKVCQLFGNPLWQAVFALHNHLPFNRIKWGVINSDVKCFRFPNLKTPPEILFASLLHVIPDFDITAHDDHYLKK